MYRHYADKRALLAAIAEDGYRQLGADIAARLSAADSPLARARLLAFAIAYLSFARREPARFQVMFGPRLNLDARFPELEVAISGVLRLLVSTLESAAPSARSRDRRDAGIALWSATHGLTSLVLSGRIPLKDGQLERYVAKVIGPTIDGLLASLDSLS